jgi:hypothetical protein
MSSPAETTPTGRVGRAPRASALQAAHGLARELTAARGAVAASGKTARDARTSSHHRRRGREQQGSRLLIDGLF